MQKLLYSPAYYLLMRLLIDLRTESGMTQKEFANEIGWGQSKVSAVERGSRMLMALELVVYLRPFGVSAAEFMRRLETELKALENAGDADPAPPKAPVARRVRRRREES